MPTAEQFIEVAERNVTVIKAMLQAIEAMALVHASCVEIAGTRCKLNFSREIAGLKEALYLMGQQID